MADQCNLGMVTRTVLLSTVHGWAEIGTALSTIWIIHSCPGCIIPKCSIISNTPPFKFTQTTVKGNIFFYLSWVWNSQTAYRQFLLDKVCHFRIFVTVLNKLFSLAAFWIIWLSRFDSPILTISLDQSHKFHNAWGIYPTVLHFVTEMFGHFCYKMMHRGIFVSCIAGSILLHDNLKKKTH